MSTQPTAMHFGDAVVISPDGSDAVPAELWSAFAALTLLEPEPDLLALWTARLEASLGVEDWQRRAISAGGVDALREAIRADKVARGLIVDDFCRVDPDMPWPGEGPAPSGHALTVRHPDDDEDDERVRRISAIRPEDERLAWYIVRAATRLEDRAEANLVAGYWDKSDHKSGFAVYIPRLKRWRRVSDKRVRHEQPLFGGYLFVGLGEGQSIKDVEATDGVHGVVRVRGVARQVAFPPIAALIAEELAGEFDRTRRDNRRDPAPGTPVEIIRGQYQGWPAKFVDRREDERIDLMLTMFRKEVPFLVDPEDVELPDVTEAKS